MEIAVYKHRFLSRRQRPFPPGMSAVNLRGCSFRIRTHLSKLSFFTRRRISEATSPHNFATTVSSYASSSRRLFITDLTILSTKSALNGFRGSMRHQNPSRLYLFDESESR